VVEGVPEPLGHLGASIRRAIVDHDQLDGPVRLAEDALDGLGQIAVAVVAGNHRADQGAIGRSTHHAPPRGLRPAPTRIPRPGSPWRSTTPGRWPRDALFSSGRRHWPGQSRPSPAEPRRGRQHAIETREEAVMTRRHWLRGMMVATSVWLALAPSA